MSIYASLPGIDTDEPNHVGPPWVYRGSHILPTDDDPRDGSIGLALIPSHITRDDRDDRPEDDQPWPWLRLHLAARLLAWAGQVEPAGPAADRVPLDHLNSDQYDELCFDLARYEEVVGELNDLNITLARKAGLASAAVARVRALHSPWKLSDASPNTYCAHCEKSGGLYRYPCPTLAALDEPKEPTS